MRNSSFNLARQNSLSPIQIQLLIFIKFHSQDKCKVSYLADEFNMTKATISDSVKVLLTKELVTKETDASDTRSYTLRLTTIGKHIADKASLFASYLEKPIEALSEEQKSVILNGLLRMIDDLNKAGIITMQRMCFSCDYYTRNQGGHYCRLLNAALAETELRLDCPEHELRSK